MLVQKETLLLIIVVDLGQRRDGHPSVLRQHRLDLIVQRVIRDQSLTEELVKVDKVRVRVCVSRLDYV